MIFDTWPRLENEIVILKKMTAEDIPALEKMMADKDVYRYEPTYLPELLSKSCREFIENDCDRLFREKNNILLGIYLRSEADRFIGIAELYGYSSEREKISVGCRLIKEVWHRGIGSSVISLLKDYSLDELKLKRITAHIRVENTASEKCALNNDFVQRRLTHDEDWGFDRPIQANKYVIYPEE